MSGPPSPVFRFWRWALIGVWCWAASSLLAAPPILVSGNPRITAVSQSGQFVIVGPPPRSMNGGQKMAMVGNQPEISLQADLLAVTCERVRHAVNTRLGASDRAGLPIHLELRPAYFETGPKPITVHPRLFRDGWKFFAELPDRMDWKQLVRLLVEADMLDFMNRENPSEPVTVPPLWLTEGLTGLLLGEFGRDLVTESQTVLIRSSRHQDPVLQARDALGSDGPLSFSELAQPTDDHLNSEDTYGRYRASATLLVNELLREDRGRKAIRDFVRDAHQNLNWQTAFLAVSGGQFQSLLEVEKWWAVASVDVTGRGPTQFWPRDRVLTELRVILTETADIPTTNGLSTVRKTLPVREIVQTWTFPAQRPVLQRKVAQLRLLQRHAPPDLASSVDEAAHFLDEYLTLRGGAGHDPEAKMELETRVAIVIRNTVRHLTQLDERLAVMARSVAK